MGSSGGLRAGPTLASGGLPEIPHRGMRAGSRSMRHLLGIPSRHRGDVSQSPLRAPPACLAVGRALLAARPALAAVEHSC